MPLSSLPWTVAVLNGILVPHLSQFRYIPHTASRTFILNVKCLWEDLYHLVSYRSKPSAHCIRALHLIPNTSLQSLLTFLRLLTQHSNHKNIFFIVQITTCFASPCLSSSFSSTIVFPCPHFPIHLLSLVSIYHMFKHLFTCPFSQKKCKHFKYREMAFSSL